MAARAFGALCSALLFWLCTLGAGPALHPLAARNAARGGVELALREVGEAPLLAARVVSSRITRAAPVERDAPTRLSPFAPLAARGVQGAEPAAGLTLARQEAAHVSRPQWRVYDAAAPPARSRSTR